MTVPWLSIAVWLPFAAGIVLLFGKSGLRSGRMTALLVSAFVGIIALALAVRFPAAPGLSFAERHEWLPGIGLQYFLAADGISIVFLLLTVFVMLMALFVSSGYARADGPYYALLLLLESGLIGTFTAQNFLHFFVFWEISLIPAFFLVKNYGGLHRSEAAFQFFLYTMLGSIAMLIAFLALGYGAKTLDFPDLALRARNGVAPLLSWTGIAPNRIALLVFLLAFAGVAVKVPVWPLHGWQPLTYTEAATPVTMLLTGAMSKMGIYALLRLILPVFPREIEVLHAPLLALGVITIIYGALAAFAQHDIKRLFAYSSLSHLGYCLLGVFAAARAGSPALADERAAALNGVILQVLSHGVIAAALFASVSFLESRSGGLRGAGNFGGLRKPMPRFAGLMGIAVFASLGLPGLCGFPAEFLIFKGAFSLAPGATAFAVLGLLLTAAYLLKFFGNVFLGPLNEKRADDAELSISETGVLAPAIAVAFLLGVVPQVVITLFNPAVTELVRHLH